MYQKCLDDNMMAGEAEKHTPVQKVLESKPPVQAYMHFPLDLGTLKEYLAVLQARSTFS